MVKECLSMWVVPNLSRFVSCSLMIRNHDNLCHREPKKSVYVARNCKCALNRWGVKVSVCDSQIAACCKAQAPENTGIVTTILSINKTGLLLSTNKMLKNGLLFASN